jgi:hypothetical protein
MVRHVVEDEVVTLPTLREVLSCVIDDMVSTRMERTISTFLGLHTPVTSAPNALAICTADVPRPPDAPLIKTLIAFIFAESGVRAVRAALPSVVGVVTVKFFMVAPLLGLSRPRAENP